MRTGEARMVMTWAKVVPVTSLRTSVVKEEERVGAGLGIETLYFRWVGDN